MTLREKLTDLITHHRQNAKEAADKENYSSANEQWQKMCAFELLYFRLHNTMLIDKEIE